MTPRRHIVRVSGPPPDRDARATRSRWACVTPNGVNFALICRHGTAIRWSSTTHQARRSPPRSRSTPTGTGRATTGTSGSTACPTSSATATASTGRRGSGNLRPEHHPTRPRRRAPCRAAGPGGAGDVPPQPGQHAEPAAQAESPGGINSRRIALEDSIVYELHVRGFTVHPVRRAEPGHLRRPGREDPLPEGSASRPSSCCRSTSSTSTIARSSTRAPASSSATSGATTRSPSPRPRRPTPRPRAHGQLGRVPRHGQGAPRRRHRGHSRRRLQPHRRGRRPRPDLPSAASTTSSITCSTSTALPATSPAAATRSTATIPVVRDLILTCLAPGGRG